MRESIVGDCPLYPYLKGEKMQFFELIKTEFSDLWNRVFRPDGFDNAEHATNVMTELSGFDWRENYLCDIGDYTTIPDNVWPRYNPPSKAIGKRTIRDDRGIPGHAGSSERIAYFASIVAKRTQSEISLFVVEN